MSQVIHYQIRLQTPLCYNGHTENVTYNLSQVTCQNCLEKKRQEQSNNGIDWQTVKQEIQNKIAAAEIQTKEFCLAHRYQSIVTLGTYPPRLILSFYVPIGLDRRRKTIGYNISTKLNEPNIVQVHIPNEDDLDTIATFVGELASTLKLRPWRERNDSGFVPLSYVLKPIYRKTV